MSGGYLIRVKTIKGVKLLGPYSSAAEAEAVRERMSQAAQERK